VASPDLDDGYLRYAHELDAALACADFTKGARIVLREVFAQVFGPARSRIARIHPSVLACRTGMDKGNLCRAIRELVDSGVLIRGGECEFMFVKDYERWTKKGAPRLSEDEISYARMAPETAMSYKREYGVNPDTGHKPNRKASGVNPDTRPVSIQTPNGVNPDTETVSKLTPNGVNPDTGSGVPPRPPIEERARPETLETKETGEKRARDPVAENCIEIATRRWGDRNGDSIVGELLHEYPSHWVRAAIDRAWDKQQHNMSPRYLRGILQGYMAEGGPPKGRDSAPPAPAAPVERKYVTATEEHIHPKFRKQA
jgi:hypothetical protein